MTGYGLQPSANLNAAGGGQSAVVAARPKSTSAGAAQPKSTSAGAVRRCELQAELRSTRKHQHRVVMLVVAVLVAVLAVTVAMLNQARSVPSPKPASISRSAAVPSLAKPVVPPGVIVGGVQ
ncbi:MAG: hypothetical protein M1115_03090, partial [Actinobacteria bacterium]|nr:hypothetical protein [Actinomycetota bacterium]